MTGKQPKTTREEGFSLIEVLVALSIFSFAAVALLQVQGESARAAVALEEKLLAEIVADNILATRIAGSGTVPGNRRGKTEMGGRIWRWDMKETAQPALKLRKIEVIVTLEESGQEVYRVSTLAGVNNAS